MPKKLLSMLAIRTKLNLTQVEAARLLQTSLRTYIAWERGETAVHPIIHRWFFECTIDAEKVQS